MEEKLEILEKWVATGQVKTARGRNHDDLLTLIGQMKVALRQPLVSGECEHPYHSVLGDGEMQPAKCLKCGKVL